MSAQKQPAGDFTGDEHWGKGGRYVVDITNGRRVPVVEDEPARVASEDAGADAAAAAKTKFMKGQQRA